MHTLRLSPGQLKCMRRLLITVCPRRSKYEYARLHIGIECRNPRARCNVFYKKCPREPRHAAAKLRDNFSPTIPSHIFSYMNPKQRAAEAALPLIHSSMTVGLGTGSTARFFIEGLARLVAEGKLRDLRCVPTSLASEQLARQLSLTIAPLASSIDITVDGADEVAPNLDLIKGLGGALLREKMVAQNSHQLIIIADESKRVTKLGTHSPLPVEVVQFSHEIHLPFFKSLKADAVLRKDSLGTPFVTDNGNLIYDCRFPGGIDDAQALNKELAARAGIVESGLFLGIATMAIIANDTEAKIIRR
jgi:ribose 5-phosphate isomerase A